MSQFPTARLFGMGQSASRSDASLQKARGDTPTQANQRERSIECSGVEPPDAFGVARADMGKSLMMAAAGRQRMSMARGNAATHNDVPTHEGPLTGSSTLTRMDDCSTAPQLHMDAQRRESIEQAYGALDVALLRPLRQGISANTDTFVALLRSQPVGAALRAYVAALSPLLLANARMHGDVVQRAQSVFEALGHAENTVHHDVARDGDGRSVFDAFPIPLLVSCFEIFYRGIHGAIPELNTYGRKREILWHAQVVLDGLEAIARQQTTSPMRHVDFVMLHWPAFLDLLADFLRQAQQQTTVHPRDLQLSVELDGLTLSQPLFHALALARAHDVPLLAQRVLDESSQGQLRRTTIWNSMRAGLSATPPRYRFAVEALAILRDDVAQFARLVLGKQRAKEWISQLRADVDVQGLSERFVPRDRQLHALRDAYVARADQCAPEDRALPMQEVDDGVAQAEKPTEASDDTRVQALLLAAETSDPMGPEDVLVRLRALANHVISLEHALGHRSALDQHIGAMMQQMALPGDHNQVVLAAYEQLASSIRNVHTACLQEKIMAMIPQDDAEGVGMHMRTGRTTHAGAIRGTPVDMITVARDFWERAFQQGVTLPQTRAVMQHAVQGWADDNQMTDADVRALLQRDRDNDVTLRAVVGRAWMHTLAPSRTPVAVNALPELWTWDVARLQQSRTTLHMLVMLANVLHHVQAMLPDVMASHPGVMHALTHAALAHAQMALMEERAAADEARDRPLSPLLVAQSVIAAMQQTWGRFGLPLSESALPALGAAIRNVAAGSTPSAGGLQAACLNALVTDLATTKSQDERRRLYPSPVLAQEIMHAIDDVRRTFLHHVAVCKPFYGQLFAAP